MPKKSKFNPQVELKKAEEQYAQIQRRLVMLEGVILYLRKTIEECVEK